MASIWGMISSFSRARLLDHGGSVTPVGIGLHDFSDDLPSHDEARRR